jgi:hypothetical protein
VSSKGMSSSGIMWGGKSKETSMKGQVHGMQYIA